MVSFSVILDTGWVGNLSMVKGKLIDGKELRVGLELNCLR